MKNQFSFFSIIVIFLIIPLTMSSFENSNEKKPDWFTVNVTLTGFPANQINGTLTLSGSGYTTTTTTFYYGYLPLETFQYRFAEGGNLAISVSFMHNGCLYYDTRSITNPTNGNTYNLTIDNYSSTCN
jgi:hypothetical protein